MSLQMLEATAIVTVPDMPSGDNYKPAGNGCTCGCECADGDPMCDPAWGMNCPCQFFK